MHQLCLLFPLLIVTDAAPMAQLLPNIPYRLDFSNHRLQPASFQGTKKRPFPQLNSEFPQPLLLDVQQDPASFPVDMTPEETTVHPRIDWLSQQAYRLVQDHAKSPKYNFEGRFQTAVERNEVDISGMMEQKQDQPMEIEGESSGHGEMAEKSDKVIEKVIGESRKKPEVEEEEQIAEGEDMKKTEEVQQEGEGKRETAKTIEIKEQPKVEAPKKQVTEEKKNEKSEKIENSGSKTEKNEKKNAMAEDKKEIDVKELKKNVEKEGNHEVKETVKSEATVDKQVKAKKEKKITTAGKVEKKEKTAEETKEIKEKPETEHTKESLVVMGRPKSEENEEKEKKKDVESVKKEEVAEKTKSKKTVESEKKEEEPKKQEKKEETIVEPETKKEEANFEKLEDGVIEMIDEVVETNELRKLVARGVSAYPQAKDYLEPYRGGGYMKTGDHEELEAKVVYVDNERAINKMAKEILKAKNPSIETKEVPPQIQPEVQIVVVEQTGEKATTLSAPQSELHAITDEVSTPVQKAVEISEKPPKSNNTTESTTVKSTPESSSVVPSAPETSAPKTLPPSESEVKDVPESKISSSPEVPSVATPDASSSNSTSAPQTSSDADAVVAAMIDVVDSSTSTVAPKSIDTTEKSIAETQHEGPRHRVRRRRLLMF